MAELLLGICVFVIVTCCIAMWGSLRPDGSRRSWGGWGK